MSAPHEIIAAFFEVWVAAVGETFTAIEDTVAGDWVKLGNSGKKNTTEDGVKISHTQELSFIRMLGSTAPLKCFRISEDFKVSLTLADLRLELYSHILNGNSVTDNAAGGAAGYREVDIYRGPTVTQKAWLIRGAGPYGSDYDMQFNIPVGVLSGDAEPTFTKGDPAGLMFEITALEDPDASSGEEFGQIWAQDADPT